MVDAGLGAERLQVVAVDDLRPVVQVDVGDRRQRLAVPGGTDLDPSVERAADEKQHGVLGPRAVVLRTVVGQFDPLLVLPPGECRSRVSASRAIGPFVAPGAQGAARRWEAVARPPEESR